MRGTEHALYVTQSCVSGLSKLGLAGIGTVKHQKRLPEKLSYLHLWGFVTPD